MKVGDAIVYRPQWMRNGGSVQAVIAAIYTSDDGRVAFEIEHGVLVHAEQCAPR